MSAPWLCGIGMGRQFARLDGLPQSRDYGIDCMSHVRHDALNFLVFLACVVALLVVAALVAKV